jgi:hypothetical protein
MGWDITDGQGAELISAHCFARQIIATEGFVVSARQQWHDCRPGGFRVARCWAPSTRQEEMVMIRSSKSKRFQAQLKALDSVLPASAVSDLGSPLAPKIDEGNDRYGGYP